MTDSNDFLCIGHRGASGLAPENTLKAFALALELGVDAIELDVQICQGELAVIHDEDLARTTNGTGKVATTTLAELRALDAGEGERIPLLHEVLDLVGGRVLVNIELKGAGTAGPVVELLRRRHESPSGILLSAFEHGELRTARTLAPEYRRGALFGRLHGDPIPRTLELGAASVNLNRRNVRPEIVHDARAAGLDVLVYTVNDTDEALALRDMGVRGVFTDLPRELLSALGRTDDDGADD